GKVREHQRRVQLLEPRRRVRGAEIERIRQRHLAVDDLDRLDLDPALGSRERPFLALALDDRPEIPAAVSLAGQRKARARQANAPDRRARLEQLADAVVERDLVDLDQWMAVADQRNVTELQAAEQRPLESPDRKGRRQVLVRLRDEEIAQPVLDPT